MDSMSNWSAWNIVVLLSVLGLAQVSHAQGPDASLPREDGTDEERLAVSADGRMVHDKATGLTWQREAGARGYTWAGARKYCASLSMDGAGWRLPSADELDTLLVQPHPADPRNFVRMDVRAFPHTPKEFFWSATRSRNRVTGVFFDMSSFPTGLGSRHDLGRVRCVRGAKNRMFAETLVDAGYNHLTLTVR
jgi:hypothetical protein